MFGGYKMKILNKIKKNWKMYFICTIIGLIICFPIIKSNIQKKNDRYERYNYFGGELIIDKETGTSMLIR